jgi:hypothetical protein
MDLFGCLSSCWWLEILEGCPEVSPLGIKGCQTSALILNYSTRHLLNQRIPGIGVMLLRCLASLAAHRSTSV